MNIENQQFRDDDLNVSVIITNGNNDINVIEDVAANDANGDIITPKRDAIIDANSIGYTQSNKKYNVKSDHHSNDINFQIQYH